MGMCFFSVAHVSVPEEDLSNCTQRMGVHQSKKLPLKLWGSLKTYFSSPRNNFLITSSLVRMHIGCLLLILSSLSQTPSLSMNRKEGRKKTKPFGAEEC